MSKVKTNDLVLSSKINDFYTCWWELCPFTFSSAFTRIHGVRGHSQVASVPGMQGGVVII